MWWSWRKKVSGLEDAQRTLEGRLRTLEASMKSVEGEWADFYDKARSAVGRLRKRDERARDAEGEPAGGLSDASPPAAVHPITGLPLDAASRRIVALRKGRG